MMTDKTSMSTCSPDEEICEIAVKNTFVHYTESRRTCRRSNSVPSSARLACDSPRNSEKGIDCWADVSTASEVEADRESVDSSQSEAPEVPESPSDASANKRTPLRSSARAWTPALMGSPTSGAMPMMPCMSPMGAGMAMGHFLLQLTTVIGAAVSALANSGYAYNVAAADGPLGWSISARMCAKDSAKNRERALTVVKESLLSAAAASENIFVAGYLAQPFTATPMGFVAEVVMAPHASEACWTILKKGFCQRGCQCRWKHPEHQRAVNVVIQVD